MKHLKNKYNYSKIQFFFWKVAGSEIDIIKECPTDYNRQASIGFTILMTTIVAFFSGTYAGYYFTNHVLSSLFFGMLWALLIFSVDRSMVVTLKKDPTKAKQNFWFPFIARAFLSILIAFVISIPVEIFIFQDNIDIHKQKFNQNKILDIQLGEQLVQNIDQKKDNQKLVQNEIEELQSEINRGEPTNDPRYENLKEELISKKREFAIINTENDRNIEAERKAKANVPVLNSGDLNSRSREYRVYTEKRSIRLISQNKRDEKNKEVQRKQGEIKNYIFDWYKRKNKELDTVKNENKALRKTIVASSSKVNDSGEKMKEILNLHDNSFIFNYMVMEDLAKRYRKVLLPADSIEIIRYPNKIVDLGSSNPKVWREEYDHEGATALFFLWLIRILFFVFELLPSIVKIATPVGAYDYAIYRKEQDLKQNFDMQTQEYLEFQKEIRKKEHDAHVNQTDTRLKIEKEIHDKLIREIADAQNSIALKKIEEFKSNNNIL